MRRYWRYILPAALIAMIIGGLLLTLQSNLVFFNTPTELLEQTAGQDRLVCGSGVRLLRAASSTEATAWSSR